MAADTQTCQFKIFNFKHPAKTTNANFDLNIKVKIPLDEPIKEFTHRVMNAFNLPIYVFDDLLNSLKGFVDNETSKYNDNLAMERIELAKNGLLDIDAIVKFWEQSFKNEHVEYTEPVATTDEELFSVVYHKLVHSPALETILQAEQAYAETARDAAKKRTDEISALSEKQNQDMADAVKNLDTRVSEKEINELVSKQFEEHSLVDGRLSSQLEGLHQQQRMEYRAWLMSVMEQLAINPTPLPSPVTSSLPEIGPLPPLNETSQWPEHEESFTIHLGSQLKQMHNVRILAADVLDFCRIKNTNGVEPRRLETALALYSSNLSGLVLLSDVGPFGRFSGLLSDFSKVSTETTELHFSSIDNQLQDMRPVIAESVEWRSERARKKENSNVRKPIISKNLQQGDVFITKHSNLSQVHVVFHMMIDDSIKSNDMSSRHPAILGLRNVLKTAANYDVTTLTLPLLLTHEMSEEMTVAWCTRRAELVFKCVKGFMIEAAGTGGADLHNLQFLVPPGISPNVFSALAAMLPSIFRVSNPLVLKTTPLTPKGN